MTTRQWITTLALYVLARRRNARRWRRLREQPQATIEETIALSWLTSMYARYGTDEQLAACYTKWHFGVWERQLPTELRAR